LSEGEGRDCVEDVVNRTYLYLDAVIHANRITMHTYKYPKYISVLLELATGVFLIASGYAIWFLHPNNKPAKLLVVSVGCLLLLSLAYYGRKFEIRIGDKGIVRKSILTDVEVEWGEVDDLICANTYTVIRASNRSISLRILHPPPGSLGIALVNHEKLRDEIIRRLSRHLLRRWSEETKTRKYRYPPKSFLLTLFFFLFPILLALLAWWHGVTMFQALALALVFYLAISPFYIKEYLESQKCLILNEQGMKVISVVGEVLIDWEEISGIRIKEPTDSFSYGMIIIESQDGRRRIRIPRSIEGLGQILYYIEKHTHLKGFSPV
jgi:hypothetical protein